MTYSKPADVPVTLNRGGSLGCHPGPWRPEEVIDDRLAGIRKKLDLVRRRIAEREDLGKRTIKELDERICEIGTEIYVLSELPCSPESNQGKTKSKLLVARANIEKELQAERLGLWRDLCELETEALGLQEEYLKIVRRRSLLDDGREDEGRRTS